MSECLSNYARLYFIKTNNKNFLRLRIESDYIKENIILDDGLKMVITTGLLDSRSDNNVITYSKIDDGYQFTEKKNSCSFKVAVDSLDNEPPGDMKLEEKHMGMYKKMIMLRKKMYAAKKILDESYPDINNFTFRPNQSGYRMS